MTTNRTRRKVRGDYLTEDRYINQYAPKYMLVDVDDQGRAWPVMPEDILPDADMIGFVGPLTAEIWGDGCYLGRHFSPDKGELERCGIKAKLCGSAIDRC
jgi:hypothetical protein